MRSGNRVPRPYKISPFEESVWPRSEKALLCVERQIFHVTGFEKKKNEKPPSAFVTRTHINTHPHTYTNTDTDVEYVFVVLRKQQM